MGALVAREGALVAREGRQRQLYKNGSRLVAGCIPYKYTETGDACDGESVGTLKVLMVTRHRGDGLVFPKGGWEDDESKEAAALREALEEAGVKGHIETYLGSWPFKSGRHRDEHSLQGSRRGYMFALNVTELLDSWPDMNVRQRKWVTVKEAKDLCRLPWMLKALEKCIDHLSKPLSESVDGCTSPDSLSQSSCEDEEPSTCEDEEPSEQSTCEYDEPSEQSTCEETDSSLAAIESNEAGSDDEAPRSYLTEENERVFSE